jgi:hypothetical protein
MDKTCVENARSCPGAGVESELDSVKAFTRAKLTGAVSVSANRLDCVFYRKVAPENLACHLAVLLADVVPGKSAGTRRHVDALTDLCFAQDWLVGRCFPWRHLISTPARHGT